MKLIIEKIPLKQLNTFVNSERYKQMPIVPISLHRALSYINNPHGKPNDICLYLGFTDDKLVAFRSVFADVLEQADETIRFAWCSGNWVDPKHRRKGFSRMLLEKAYVDWNGKLMFTNYAPDSEKLYIKTGWFKAIHKFEGARAYLYPKTKKLLAGKDYGQLKQFGLSVCDSVIHSISALRLLFFRDVTSRNYQFKIIETPDAEFYKQVGRNSSNQVYRKSPSDYKWVFHFPWILNDESELKLRYPFSAFDPSFQYRIVKVYKESRCIDCFLFSVRDGHLKTLYFGNAADYSSEIVQFLKSYCKKHKIEIITVYNSEIAQQLFARKFPFLRLRKYGQKIYSSFEIKKDQDFQFQDGDGDVIFT